MKRFVSMTVATLVAAFCLALASSALGQGLNYPDMMYFKMNGSSYSSPVNDAFPRVGNSSASYNYYTSSYTMNNTTGVVRNAANTSTTGARYPANWTSSFGYYADTGYNFDIKPTDSCTVEFWARSWNYYSSYSYAFGTSSNGYFSAYQQSNRVYFYFGNYRIDSNVNNYRSPTSSTWTHYAMVYDGPNRQLRTYIDGNLSNTSNNVNPNQSAQRVYLFNYRSYYGCCSAYYKMYGYLDEMRFWRRARTQQEIANNKDNELTKPSGFYAGTKGGLAGGRVRPTNNQVVWRGTLGSPSTSSNLSSITWTKTGSLPDSNITSVKLYSDNGNGQPSSQLATGSMSNGQVQLNYSRSFSTDQLIDVVLTYDISSSAPGGASFGATIASDSDINLSSGTALSFSDAAGPMFSIQGKVSNLPWSTNFDSLPDNAAWYNLGTPSYPYTSSTTSTPNVSWTYSTSGSNFPTNNQIGGSYRGWDPISAPNMAIMEFGQGPNHDALDFSFDLSNYTLSTDQIILTYNWLESTGNYGTDWYGVFISTNGGSSWLRKMVSMDPNNQGAMWQEDSIDLQAVLQGASQSSYSNNILIRFQGLGNSDGHYFLFDDFDMVVRTPSLMIDEPSLPVSTFPVAPGASDIVVHAAKVSAMVDPQSVTSLTVTKTGDMADAEITEVKLFADTNGNGFFDGADTQLGMDATFTNGEAAFTGSPLAALAADSETVVFVTYTLDAMATAGATFGASLAASTDIVISSSDPVTAAGGFPFNGPELQVAQAESLPFSTSFEGGMPGNISGSFAAGSYPSAGSVTTTVAGGFTGAPARIQLNSGALEGVSAFEGRKFMSIDYPSGQGTAAGAIDFSFDLSSYDASTDSITFAFWVQDMSGGEDNGPLDGVFISDDAGATWLAKAWHPDWDSINGWERIDINLSEVMTTASASFTGDMLIRIQSSDDLGAPWDGVAIDNIFCGLSAVASVSRMGNDIADGGMESIGNVTLASPTTLTFDIANLGHQDLEVGSLFATSNEMNIDSTVGFTFTLAEDSESFEVSFQPEMSGAFSFDLEIPFPNDPSLTGGMYVITVDGEGGLAPMITSTAPAIATVGRVYTYDLTADGSPAPTFSVLNAPSWLTLTGSSLSGTPTSADVGQTAPITVTATNGVGTDDTQDFQINVSQEVQPTITSMPITMATVGQVYQYILSADGAPEPTFSVTGLPSWLTLNGNVITGTAAAQPGMPVPTYMTGTITVTATNGIGLDAQQTFEITVVDPAVAASAQINSVPATSAEAGVAYSYQIGVTGNPTPTVMVSGLPAWLAFDSVTNVISGTPAATDSGTTAEISITAENGVGQDATQSFTLMVIDGSTEARITSVPATFIQTGQDYSYTIIASGDPAPTIDVTGLPAWLTYDSATATITGMPTAAEIGLTTAITVTASNGIGVDDVQSFQIVVIPAPSAASSDDAACALATGNSSNAALLLLLATLATLAIATRKRHA